MSFVRKLFLIALGVVTLAGHVAQAGPPASASVYVWRADLGGWLDTSTNLVWGYSSMGISNTPVTSPQAETFAANYATTLRNSGYVNEADVAGQYVWRLPNLGEYQDAFAKGLFWEDGTTGLYDQSPAAGFQSPAYGWLKWTSTPGTGKNKKLMYYFETTGGTWGTATKTSGLNAIVVRKHVN